MLGTLPWLLLEQVNFFLTGVFLPRLWYQTLGFQIISLELPGEEVDGLIGSTVFTKWNILLSQYSW